MTQSSSSGNASGIAGNVGCRIGLFGGTFDPVHFGHLRPALELAERYALDVLNLVPNHRPVHRGPTEATTDHRLAMLELAVADSPLLQIDSREARREGPSYSVDTLAELNREYPQAQLIFFMGMDAFAGFEGWHQWERILQLAHLVVVNRPGAAHSPFSEALVRRQSQLAGAAQSAAENAELHDGGQTGAATTGVIEVVDVTQLAISATDIRARAERRQSLQFLLPDTVREYIDTHGLYRS